MPSKYVVYTMPNCPDCKNAKQLLEARGCVFEEVTEFTPAELRDLVGPVRSLPQIIHSKEGARFHVGGFKDLQSYLTGQLAGRRID